ncbi:tyrosinase [Amylostereum chailletii]|nr:tyrosinase [Amylostereum chailletii]
MQAVNRPVKRNIDLAKSVVSPLCWSCLRTELYIRRVRCGRVLLVFGFPFVFDPTLAYTHIMSRFVVKGASGGQTQGADAPNRLEINDLVKIEDQFSLYIQALTQMFKDDQKDLISFFQIGGIHGLPYVQWDGSGGKEPIEDAWGGYCTHGSMLFPTWHRPYVALFEQVLQQHAISIANTYTADKARWTKAAANLRAPYWDWAANSVPPAEVISLKNVDIIGSNGHKTSVANPLFQYTFHPVDPSFPAPYSKWHTTLRHPTSSGANATTNVASLKSDLSAAQEDITTSTYNLLTRVHTWPAFSNHTPGDGGSTSNSLEAIHDGIHDDVGAGGQMGDTSVAGFDPIFFLHHANVDRMLSLWSALNPDVWVSSGPAEGGTWTIPPDATVDANTNLTPFWDSQTKYWVSTQATATSTFGYTYPEFNGLDMSNKAAVQAAIAQAVNKLYGGPVFGVLSSGLSSGTTSSLTGGSAEPTSEKTAQPPAGNEQQERSISRSIAPSTASQPSAHNADGSYYDWTARIQVKKYALGGSFSVLIFLGEVPEDPAQWRSSPSFVGAHHAFVNTSAERCANCRTQADVVVEGFVHLNNAIARRAPELGSFDPSVVHPYLSRELSWRVQRVDRTAVDLHDVPSLEVAVSATPLTLEPGAVFPTPGDARYHHGITSGRQGGSSGSA